MRRLYDPLRFQVQSRQIIQVCFLTDSPTNRFIKLDAQEVWSFPHTMNHFINRNKEEDEIKTHNTSAHISLTLTHE